MQTAEITVWDPFVRVFHWLLAFCVVIAWFADEPLWLHTWLGYTAAALIILRVIWGFIGSKEARFSSFVCGPRIVLQYLGDLIRLSSKRYLGHSPAGGAMILVLLFMVAVTAVTGMVDLAVERGEGPLGPFVTKMEEPSHAGTRSGVEHHQHTVFKDVHEIAANVTIILVVLHLAGVALASFAHRENLVRSMITGRKHQ
jgi:cytochrome b